MRSDATVKWDNLAERMMARARPERVAVPLSESAQEELQAHEEARRLAAWREAIPRVFWRARITDLAAPVSGSVCAWLDGEPRNLVLFGPVGTGKTHAAVAALRARFALDYVTARFAPAVELLDELRPGGPDGAMERAAAVDWLLLDDLGSERATDWTAERMYALVNRRWLDQRPIIATTNLDPDELKEHDPRLYSRLMDGAAVLRLGGDDRRLTRAE